MTFAPDLSPELSQERLTLPSFRAVIFDMDGLALDTESTYCHAWRSAAADLGFELSEEFCRGLFGHHADDVERALRAALGDAFDRGLFHQSAERHWRSYLDDHGIGPMAGLKELLIILQHRAISYALATNSDGPYARECLHRSGIEESFPIVVTRNQVERGKPAPDLFLEAAKRLNVPPGLCVVLEDSGTGLEAARAAGTIPVLIQRREEMRNRLAELAVLSFPALQDFADLLETVR
ncbi:HAD family phosphatase [Methylocaldum sp.]|uniref:HAD family hydrolase n=1 Tax=Methylocaldum sp. TaxID=1969727 RepID=UPI002D3C2EE6|nr:HAD family phosphatase [Methylocaldum sp.]HYE35767.1 HAD family phosphatase [Methylocaldum sp.]